jgi:hypothetical protein
MSESSLIQIYQMATMSRIWELRMVEFSRFEIDGVKGESRCQWVRRVSFKGVVRAASPVRSFMN